MSRQSSGAQSLPCVSPIGDADGWCERDEQSARDEDDKCRPPCALRSGPFSVLVSGVLPLAFYVRHSIPSVPLGTSDDVTVP